jgi:hypothetical protein
MSLRRVALASAALATSAGLAFAALGPTQETPPAEEVVVVAGASSEPVAFLSSEQQAALQAVPKPTTTTTTAPPPPPTAPPTTSSVPVPTPTTAAPPAPTQAAGSGDPYDPASWDRLAQCESGGNWHINTGNGYYGGIQFSLSSWQAVGGQGYPHENSREEQIRRGQMLWEQGGWAHWPGCTRKFGWR